MNFMSRTIEISLDDLFPTLVSGVNCNYTRRQFPFLKHKYPGSRTFNKA